MTSLPTPQKIRDIILNLKHPYVLKNIKLPWKCFNVSFEDWANIGGSAEVFSCNLTGFSHPQWERFHKKTDLETFKQIASDVTPTKWACMNYQPVQNLPEECTADINFSTLGFDEIEHSSWWLGTKGANTSCHYDTYGCNIVVQVIGRKQWILLPNDAKLTPTRVPYEESSVYCKENFFSPDNLDTFRKVQNQTFYVILEPGDILLVPPKWWHYVENLTNSLAINTWIQLNSDRESQIEEGLVNTLIKGHTKDLNQTQLSMIVNPNCLQGFAEEDTLSIINHLVEEHESEDDVKSSNTTKRKKSPAHDYGYLQDDAVLELLNENSTYFHRVNKLKSEDLAKILKQNSQRFDRTLKSESCNELTVRVAIDLINATCCPHIIKQIREQYIKERLL